MLPTMLGWYPTMLGWHVPPCWTGTSHHVGLVSQHVGLGCLTLLHWHVPSHWVAASHHFGLMSHHTVLVSHSTELACPMTWGLHIPPDWIGTSHHAGLVSHHTGLAHPTVLGSCWQPRSLVTEHEYPRELVPAGSKFLGEKMKEANSKVGDTKTSDCLWLRRYGAVCSQWKMEGRRRMVKERRGATYYK